MEMRLLGQRFFHRQEMISKLLGCRRKAPRQVHDDIESLQDHLCCCKLVFIGLPTGLPDDFPIV